MSHTLDSAASVWLRIPAVRAAAVSDARLQLHHAAQVANAGAMSYLAPAADDSHTNFGWRPDLRAFVSRRIDFREALHFAFRPADLTLLALSDSGAALDSIGLAGQTLDDAHAWARERCEAAGGDGARYTSRKHYEIPPHAVVSGAPFGADADALEALAQLWDNAARFLDAVAAMEKGASDVRLWPHHFDIGLIIGIDATRSIGGGLSPGDHHYDEPYWYVSPYPGPTGPARPSLAGGAHWHEREFFSAVLPLRAYIGAADQGVAVRDYLRTALVATKSMLNAQT